MPPEITTDINERLKSLCSILKQNSLNYAVDFWLYTCMGLAGRSLAEIVEAGVGHSVTVGGSRSATAQELLESFQAGLKYAGDSSSHPNLTFLGSNHFEVTMRELIEWFDQFNANADQIIGFWFKQGHPFYPVFWDFAYVIEKGLDAFVFVGSSSD